MTTQLAQRHVHVADYDEATGPDHTGTLLITEVCACGDIVRVYTDSVA